MGVRLRDRLAITVVVALVAAGSMAVVHPSAVRAAFPGAQGRIAWQKNDALGSHIWTMRPDGTDKRDIGPGTMPAWSPDGSKLVFSTNPGISVMDADGGNVTQVLDHGGWPTWSPDGNKIAFSYYDNGALNYDVYVMNANGTGVTNITNNAAEDLDPSWSPDGTKIAFRTNRTGTSEIWTVEPTGLNPTNLSNGTPGSDPDWSPDGSKIVFAGVGIWTMNANGTGKAQLTVVPDGIMPAWSPDGTRIVFASDRDYNVELYSMAANGTGALRLTNDNTTATYPEDWFATWQPTAFALAPGAVGFGTVVVGTPTAARIVTLTAGTSPLTVTSVATGGANAADFQKTADSCSGIVLAARASCSISVRMNASATGARTGTLDVTGLAPLGSASVALTGFGRLFLWGTDHYAGPTFTFNDGRSLASTVSGSTTYHHAIYATTRIGSSWVTDSGPYTGVYYIRTSNRGSTWTTPKRLNPTSQHGSRATVASSGAYVYAAWVRTTKWVHYSSSAPRVLYFRRNTSNGSSSGWSATVRITSTTGRVDWPTIAASGSYVYLAYTDSATGSIKLRISANRGSTWKTVTVGSTTKSSGGRLGLPHVAASGSSVAVTWIADSANTVKVRIGSSYGASWGATTTMGTTSSVPDVAVLGGRVAATWASDTVKVRVATTGTWGLERSLPATDGYADEVQYGPAIALLGSQGLAVAYSSCILNCATTDPELITRSDLIWRQTTDNGATWAPSDVLETSASGGRRQNDAPSIVWRSAARPSVLWNAWTQGTTYFRLHLRSGV